MAMFNFDIDHKILVLPEFYFDPCKLMQDGLLETEPIMGPLAHAERRRLRMLEGWFGMSADAWLSEE